MTKAVKLFLENEQATLALGASLAVGLVPGMLVALHGPLGAGKTTLTRGVLHALGFGGHVKSPTYALVELYKLSRLDLYHFDFYRFSEPEELIESGLQEAFNETSVCIVEWPERAGSLLPIADIDVSLAMKDGARSAQLTAHTEKGRRCLQQLTT
ncbi:MAG: tRNA (adenosine(37)-N6)-threonylcarbamoyltransferase complex ATPase subunit type 1 TsaE [Betaproteobacteria bacterium]|nr:MAG: tRNA (adenosine(37)-N6)-threonylcarbamoyltransferase complex ATPase subunit type 1 TsaE [Betaproteobacteria bacterium]